LLKAAWKRKNDIEIPNKKDDIETPNQ